MFWCFFLVWYICACGFIPSYFACTIDLLFCLTIYEWSLASTILLPSPWHQVPDFYSMSSWVDSTLASASGVCLGRVHWNTFWMVGWSLSPSLILGWYWAFHVLMFLSCLVHLCSWIYSILFCMHGFANPMSYSIVLGDTDQTVLSKNHIRSALLLTSANSLLYLRCKLAKVHRFINSLIHLEPGLCQNKPPHRA